MAFAAASLGGNSNLIRLPSRVKKPRSSPYFTDFEVFKSIHTDYVHKKFDEKDMDVKTAGKRMQMLIKDYLNGIERILKKHAKGVQEALTGYLKRKSTVSPAQGLRSKVPSPSSVKLFQP